MRAIPRLSKPGPRATLLMAAATIEAAALGLWPAAYLLSSTEGEPSRFGTMFIERYPPVGWVLTTTKQLVDWLLPGALWSGERLVAFTAQILVVAFLAYVVAAWRLTTNGSGSAPPARPRLRWIVGPLIVFQTTLIFVPGTMTTDIYSYALYGEMPVLYHANPFTHTPSQFPQSPLYYLIPLYWHDAASVYGPLWVTLSAGVALLSRTSALADELLTYRIIANLAHLANAALVWSIAQRLHPPRAASATVAYAWNPLLLLEFALNGHNDVLMLTFALIAIRLAASGRLAGTAVALGCSIAMKYTTVLIAGPLLFAVARVGHVDVRTLLRRLALAGLVALGVVAAWYALWFEGPDTFAPAWYWMSGPRSNNFWPEPLIATMAGWLAAALDMSYDDGWNTAMAGFKLVARGVLGVWIAVEALRVRRLEDALAASARIMLGFLLLVNTWVMPWYYTWPLALCAALGWERTVVRVCAGFTLTALLVIYQRQYGAILVQEMAGLFLVLPLVLAGAAPTVQRVRGAMRAAALRSASRVPRGDAAPAR